MKYEKLLGWKCVFDPEFEVASQTGAVWAADERGARRRFDEVYGSYGVLKSIEENGRIEFRAVTDVEFPALDGMITAKVERQRHNGEFGDKVLSWTQFLRISDNWDDNACGDEIHHQMADIVLPTEVYDIVGRQWIIDKYIVEDGDEELRKVAIFSVKRSAETTVLTIKWSHNYS